MILFIVASYFMDWIKCKSSTKRIISMKIRSIFNFSKKKSNFVTTNNTILSRYTKEDILDILQELIDDYDFLIQGISELQIIEYKFSEDSYSYTTSYGSEYKNAYGMFLVNSLKATNMDLISNSLKRKCESYEIRHLISDLRSDGFMSRYYVNFFN